MCLPDTFTYVLTDDLTASGRSFMWQRNNMGPSTVPCGTPESTVICWDDSPSNVTSRHFFNPNPNTISYRNLYKILSGGTL
jgi:hypothetical protein